MPVVRAGDVVFSTEPFACVLSDKEHGKRCDHCFARPKYLVKCPKCKFLKYCNKICQKHDWKNHRNECFHLKRFRSCAPTDFIRLLTRVVFKLRESSPASETILNDETLTFDSLVSYEDDVKRDEKRKMEFAVSANHVRRFIGEENMPPSNEYFRIFCKTIVNVKDILCKDSNEEIGQAIYLGLAKLRHSCCPNSEIQYVGTKAEVHALKDIHEPSVKNVFVSYISQDPPLPLQLRQAILKADFYFDCNCALCKSESFESRPQNSRRWSPFDFQGDQYMQGVKRPSAMPAVTITEISSDDDSVGNREKKDEEKPSKTAGAGSSQCQDSAQCDARGPEKQEPSSSQAPENQENETPTQHSADAAKEQAAQLEATRCNLNIEFLQQQLAQDKERHAMHMRVEAQRLRAYEEQLASFTAQRRYWELKVRDLHVPFVNMF